MYKYCFALLLLISNSAFSQQKHDEHLWRLTVVDSASNKGIDHATVSIEQKKYITDKNGFVAIKHSINDSIKITCIGYNSKIIGAKANYAFPNTVKLITSVTLLNEVKVISTPKGVLIGEIKKSYNTHRTVNPEEAHLQYIPNSNRIKGVISTVEYVLHDELKGIEKPFRVRLYTKNKNSIYPDQELTTDSIIVYNSEQKKRISLDVSRYNIRLPEEGIMVSFETLAKKTYHTDSVLYNNYPFRNAWLYKIPGIDMNLTKKDSYTIDNQKLDRKGAYCMEMYAGDEWDMSDPETADLNSYVFTEGINFAIAVTVEPE